MNTNPKLRHPIIARPQRGSVKVAGQTQCRCCSFDIDGMLIRQCADCEADDAYYAEFQRLRAQAGLP